MSLLCKLVLLFVYTASTKTVLGRTEPEANAGNRLYWHWEYTRVRITNYIEDKSSFTIHCKSGDDDLGIHVIQAGETYHWKFRVNFWETTLFYCNTYWNGKFLGFDAFDAENDQGRCKTECIWRVIEAGILGYNQETEVEDRFFMWR